jgi:aspartate oxidase
MWFIVYAKAASALAAHSISENHDIYGEFMQMKPYFIPLLRYAQLISETLRGELAMFTEIKDPRSTKQSDRLSRGAEDAYGL